MISKLRFKNWRSLRDVEIDNLTPITVFIGANSSGKSNIVDGLKFLRYAAEYGAVEAVYRWGGYSKIHTIGIDEEILTVLEVYFSKANFTSLTLLNEVEDLSFRLSMNLPDITDVVSSGLTYDPDYKDISKSIQRWQILDEDFMPPVSKINSYPLGSLYEVDPKAQNVPFILDFMRQTKPDIYAKLQEDLAWMLEHVDKLDTTRDANETRLLVNEKPLGGGIAPTISGGTARAIGMLTAMYVLEMSTQPELPGLVVIEEPDKSIHPLLLYKLVEVLRYYVDSDHPRQIFLTTHNPRLVNLFAPEEVRIVERDENGATKVCPVNKEIYEIWQDEHGVGDVWVTRSLGGVPE